MVHKKGQSGAIWMIIVLAVGILVLVGTLIAYNRFSSSGQDTLGACANLGGSCVDPIAGVEEATCPTGRAHNAIGDRSCKKETRGSVCCMLAQTDATT